MAASLSVKSRVLRVPVSARFEPGRARTGIKRGGVTTSAELKRELDQTVIVQTNAYGELMRLKEGTAGLHAELSERVARLRWQLETAEKREEQERKAKAAEEAEKRRKLDLETDGATARRQQKRLAREPIPRKQRVEPASSLVSSSPEQTAAA